MMNPRLYQQVNRISTTPGLHTQHIIRTTDNSQTTTHAHNEANNNILTTHHITGIHYPPHRSTRSRNSNEFGSMDLEDNPTQPQWSTDQICWDGEGEMPNVLELEHLTQQNSSSMMSFQSNLTDSSASASFHSQLSEQSESREEEVSLVLNKIRSQNKVEASKILLAMSTSVENCIIMRNCGCLPLLVELLHCLDENSNTYQMAHAKRIQLEVRERASQVLHNIVFSQPDDKKSRREARVLKLLEQIRDYCDQLRNQDGDDNRNAARTMEQQLGTSVASLMKLSFDEDHRHAMCQLGGLQAVAELLQMEQEVHGCTSDQYCITIRRYAGMVLTNLTFGDGANKSLLCSMRPFMEALVAQLYSPSEDLRQVTASVLRNLSWRADPSSKRILRDVGAVTMLVKAAMEAEKESTLKSILSALWNLSAHCSSNKADICHVDGALAFLVSTLTYKSKSKTLAIVENGGGILRNVSSHIAIQNDYRIILRKHNCLQILLQHLKYPSLTVVSNACGTLWNLSARNAVDQRALWEMGAVGMLKKLINSKHKMISMGSSAALKNLLSAKPPGIGNGFSVYGDNFKGTDDAPSLMVRKQKALNTELDQNLTETYDITDSPKTSPVKQANDKQNRTRRHISPSARYMTNQKLRSELSLPSRSTNSDGLNSSIVVEEKHNGAFQVTKNAKQAMSYRQSQNKFQHEASNAADRRSAESGYDTSRQGSAHGKNEKHSFSAVDHDRPKSNIMEPKTSTAFLKKENKSVERITNSAKSGRHNSLPDHVDSNIQNQPVQKQFPESKIPLPKSFNSNRSQSASPVAQRRNVPQRQESAPVTRAPVDINITHPKCAWTSSYEKDDNEPEHPVNFSKRLGKEEPPPALNNKLFVTRIQQQQLDEFSNEDEVKVYKTENTPSTLSLMPSLNDLEELNGSTRCSLNIKTSTNVRMIKNHPLLVNANAYRADDDDARVCEPRYGTLQKHDQYADIEEGKTVDFSVQSDYDIEETLSMMSRSSSMASISSFDHQSFHEDDSFASDLSHRSSGIESPSELSDSPCQTAPSSPKKERGGLSDRKQTEPSAGEEACKGTLLEEQVTDKLIPLKESFMNNEESNTDATETAVLTSEVTTCAVLNKSSSHSSTTSLEDTSSNDRQMLEDCIRAGMPQSNGVRPKAQPMVSTEMHPKACNYEGGRIKPKNLEVKENEIDKISDNEEKGKEDERKAEKTRLFRIPESPVDKKIQGAEELNKVAIACSSNKSLESNNTKIVIDKKGNRRFEKNSQKSTETDDIEGSSSQLSFLMTKRNSLELEQLNDKPNRSFDIKSPEEARSQVDEVENQEFSTIEDSDNSYFTCYSETRSSDKRRSKTSENSDCFQTVDDMSRSSKSSKPKTPEELSEKDIDCSERDEDDETMIKSSILDEAKEIAQALLDARMDSTEDMTVSTLSCLSDIDNARPPSVMAEIGCLSMNSSTASEENLKLAVTRECQKLFGNKQVKKSLLRELQIGRLVSNDHSNASNDSCENLSLKSSCTSELLGNVNPPSILDELSLTASTGSLEGSDSECERNIVKRYQNNQDSMSERMHDAAAISKLYAKELSHITGNADVDVDSDNILQNFKTAANAAEVVEVTIADVTEIGCDTIGSDTELEDDLPCDDECDSESFQTAQQTPMKKEFYGEGSTENLTETLTEETQAMPQFDFHKQNVCFMTAEQLRALQENADMILNTLKDVEISDEETGGMSNGDMLEDETMSLVSNESDEEFLSPDGQRIFHAQKAQRKCDNLMSPTCNGMVALPQSTSAGISKQSLRKSSLPQFSPRKKPNDQTARNRFSYPESSRNSADIDQQSVAQNNSNGFASKIKPSYKPASALNQPCYPASINRDNDGFENGENVPFDTRTFTRKRSTIPKDMIPSVQTNSTVIANPIIQKAGLKSPTSTNMPFITSNAKVIGSNAKTEPNKSVSSKIANVWKNSGKARSKSAADVNRHSKLQLASGGNLCKDENKNGYSSPQRSPTELSGPKSPFEAQRPTSLAIGHNTPSHSRVLQRVAPQNGSESQHKSEEDCRRLSNTILSPTSYQSGSNLAKAKGGSLIPRSMIPMPSKANEH